jgi:hypothetical protein
VGHTEYDCGQLYPVLAGLALAIALAIDLDTSTYRILVLDGGRKEGRAGDQKMRWQNAASHVYEQLEWQIVMRWY